jgi:hypothetical protein
MVASTPRRSPGWAPTGVTIDIQLYWIDRYGKTQVAPGTTILTNDFVADPSGKVLKPPAPGNPVPERNA